MNPIVFTPYRSIRQYLGQAGSEANGMMLPQYVLNSHADCVTRDLPEEHVVMGQSSHPDGRVFLTFGATPAYIEATTNFRDVPGKGLIYVCPFCQGHSGKHERNCKA